MRRQIILLCGLLISMGAAYGRTVVLTVATNGNDAWSGQIPSPSFSGVDGPLATLSEALHRAAEARAQGDTVTILLRKGIYPLSAPITVTPACSGASAENPLVIAAYPNERPVLSGGRRITGWHPVPGREGVWQVYLPDVREGKWYFHELFVNGQRRQRARTPNDGYYHIQGPSPQDSPATFKFRPGDIEKQWATDSDVEVVAYFAWADIRMQIRAVDETNHIVTLSGTPRKSNRENDAQYYIENAPDALDQPGEWYLNRHSGVLTYWAEPWEDMSRAVVIAPRLHQLVIMRGDPQTKATVHHVTWRGITFAYTDWSLGPHGYADTQAAVAVHGDFEGEWVRDCTIEDCTFTHLADYAIELGRGAKHCRVVGNEIRDIGAGGVRIGEQTIRTNEFDTCGGHIVTDNDIHDLGNVYAPAVGVFILQSAHNRIAHNDIYDLYYTGISVGWTWGYKKSPCHDNLIEYNNIHDIGKGLLSDMGGVYTLGPQQGTVIRNNIIHDVVSHTYGGWGLYTDEGSSDIVLENNIVYRCKSAGFHQHYGRNNIVRNNIFAFNREHEIRRTRQENHISFFFTNNIIYYNSGDLLAGSWSNDQYVMDGNDYYDARPEARPETMRFAGATFAQWQKRGHDLHSIIANPLFYNPRAYNFRLSSNSPALALGFQPIDTSQVGIRPKALRP